MSIAPITDATRRFWLTKLAPQPRLLLDYLLSGRAISRLVADTNLGIAALPRRVKDLQEAGVKVTKERKKDFKGIPYTSYSMTAEEIERVQALLTAPE